MALAEAAHTSGTCASGECTLTSWTPAEGDYLILGFVTRSTALSASPSGNGQTWTQVSTGSPLLNEQSQFELHAWEVPSATSPSAGSITLGLGANTKPIAAIAVRITGSNNGGGSPLGVFATNDGPAVDDDDMLCDITTGVNGSWALAFGSSRAGTFTVPGDETTIQVNLQAGTGGDLMSLHCWYLSVPTAGAVQVGAANDLNSARDWAVWVGEVLVGAAAGGQPTMKRLGRPPFRPVEVGRKSPGGVWCIGSPSPALARA